MIAQVQLERRALQEAEAIRQSLVSCFPSTDTIGQSSDVIVPAESEKRDEEECEAVTQTHLSQQHSFDFLLMNQGASPSVHFQRGID